MRCWNCNYKIPENAKVCPRCEAAVEDAATPEEEEFVRQMLEKMPPDALAQLQQAFEQSDTAEDFADRIFVGDCPKCGSSKTGNCEKDPEIDNLLVGRCYDCGQLWCTECENLLTLGATDCPCWDEEPDF